MKKVPVSIRIDPIKEDKLVFDYDAPFDKKGIVKRLLQQKETFVIWLKMGLPDEGTPEVIMRSGVTSSWFIALNCFAVQQHAATILFATIAVESLLNRDSRLYQFRNGGKQWLNLNDGLNKARDSGIDVSDLEDSDGTFTTFSTRRNKIAHGDVLGYIDFLNPKKFLTEHMMKTLSEDKLEELISDKTAITENQAFDQLQRSFNFIKKWAKSNPTFMVDDKD